MTQTKLNMTLLLRRDDFTAEANKGYVLQEGEPGYCKVEKVFKVGDGTTTWENLGFANQAQIEALIKAVDDKVAALDSTYATDAEVEEIRKALVAAIDLKLAAETFNNYSATRQLTDTEINTAIGNVDAKFASYRTSADQDVIDNAIKGRLDTLEAKPFDTYATKTDVQNVATDLSEYETANNTRVKAIEDEIATYGDIVTHNAAEFETAGAAAEAEGRVNETLKNYYTKNEADAAFTTPAEVIAEVNKALSEVSDADTITNITTLVEYVNEHGGDLTELISEVYGSAEMTGDSRLDTIEAKAAMGITADDITAWNAEKGVKAIVDANKATWDKAGTAVQSEAFETFKTENTAAIGAAQKAGEDAAAAVAKDLADYETTNDARVKAVEDSVAALDATYVTETELEGTVNTLNGEIDKKLDASTYEAYIAGKSMSDEELKTYADAKVSTFNTEVVAPLAERVTDLENAVDAIDVGVTQIIAGNDIVVTPEAGTGAVTIAHETFTTGEYTKDPATSDKTGDQYLFTGVTVDNGHVTGANVKSLASILEGMEFILDGGSAN